MSLTANKIIEIAKAEVGTEEEPVNKTKYGKWYGMNGQPWCAMFVSWCFSKVPGATSLIAQSPKGFAGCEAFEAWAKKKELNVPVATVQAGDIALFDFNKQGKSIHVGLVIGYDKNKHLIETIEGNTSGEGKVGSQDNGEGVHIRHRSPSLVRMVVRPKYKD